MDTQEALTSLHKQRVEVLRCIDFFKAAKKLENFGLIEAQFLAQRDVVIMKLRKEDDDKKIYRLQGRLDQIEELFSFEGSLELRRLAIEKRINELSKGMKNGN